MANRSYHYSTNDLPGSPEWSEKKIFYGIAEFNYDIPLVFKILLTRNPAARPLIDESIQFLRAPKQARKFFILECGEIFDLTEGSLAEKNMALLAEIQEIVLGMDRLPVPHSTNTKQGILSTLFNLRTPDPLSPYSEIGLGAWSEILYFDFSQNET